MQPLQKSQMFKKVKNQKVYKIRGLVVWLYQISMIIRLCTTIQRWFNDRTVKKLVDYNGTKDKWTVIVGLNSSAACLVVFKDPVVDLGHGLERKRGFALALFAASPFSISGFMCSRWRFHSWTHLSINQLGCNSTHCHPPCCSSRDPQPLSASAVEEKREQLG